MRRTRRSPPGRPDELRALVQRFVRGFGLLSPDTTPCGTPLSPSTAHALMVLLRRPDLTQQALVSELGIDKSNVARLCARMESAGQIEQRRSPDDGRSRLVRLTAKGERMARQVDTASHSLFARVYAELPPDRRTPIEAALQTLIDAIEAVRTRDNDNEDPEEA